MWVERYESTVGAFTPWAPPFSMIEDERTADHDIGRKRRGQDDRSRKNGKSPYGHPVNSSRNRGCDLSSRLEKLNRITVGIFY